MPPLSERAQMEKNCASCYKSALQVHLNVCARCKFTPYCSHECQKKHWKTHKIWCSRHVAGQDLIENMTKKGVLINGISPVQVDRKFRRWMVAAQPIMDRFTVAAMDFAKHPDRCFTHVVLIAIKSNLSASNMKAVTSSDTIKHFLIEYAYMCRIDEMPANVGLERTRETIREALPESRKTREDGNGFGTAFAVVRFPALGINQFTHLFLNNEFDPTQEPKVVNWVAELKEHIRSGTVL